MKSALFICWMLLSTVSGLAQDFASRFLAAHKADSTLSCVTVGPKMMAELLKYDECKDPEMSDMISSLKSMQVLTASTNGRSYYSEALQLVKKNSGRFEPYLAFNDEQGEGKILVRTKRGTIVEVVMFKCEKRRFVLVNLTGKISPEFAKKMTLLR